LRISADADAVARWCLRVARASDLPAARGFASLGVGASLALRLGPPDG
jgi:hypothetical protein